jgi:hypothetical protein
MVDWMEVGKLVVSAIGGGAVGAWFQGRNQDRVERQRQRERAADLVGIATQLHVDTAPKRVALQVKQMNSEHPIRALMERHDEVRTQLWTLQAWHRSPQVRAVAHRLPQLMVASLDRTGAYVTVCLDKEDFDHEEGLEDAMHAYDEVSRLLGDLIRAVERG